MQGITNEYRRTSEAFASWWTEWATGWAKVTKVAAAWARRIERWPPELSAEWSQTAEAWAKGTSQAAEESVASAELLRETAVLEDLSWARSLEETESLAVSKLVWEARAAAWSEEASAHSKGAVEIAHVAASTEEAEEVIRWLEDVADQMKSMARWVGLAAEMAEMRAEELTWRLEQLSGG